MRQVRDRQIGRLFVLDDPISERFTDSTEKILDQRGVYQLPCMTFARVRIPVYPPETGKTKDPFP